ncbi:hypothetical protein F5051DRAFT_417167, partial [Lentinula edodes]
MSLRKRSSGDDEDKAPRKRPKNWRVISNNVDEDRNGGDSSNMVHFESPLLAPLLAELHRIFVSGALSPELTTIASADLSVLVEVLNPCSGCTTLTKCNAGTDPCCNCSTKKKKKVCSVPIFLRYWIYSKRTGLTLEQTRFMISNYCDRTTKKSFYLDSAVFNNHLRQVAEKNLLPPHIAIDSTSVLGNSPTDLENRVKALNICRSPVIRLPARATLGDEQLSRPSSDLLIQTMHPSSSSHPSSAMSFGDRTGLISPIPETPVRVIHTANPHKDFQPATSIPLPPSKNSPSVQYVLTKPPEFSGFSYPLSDECTVQAQRRSMKAGPASPFNLFPNSHFIENVSPLSSLEEDAPPLPSMVPPSIQNSLSIDLISAPFSENPVIAHRDQTRVSELEQLLAWAREQFRVERSGIKAQDHLQREIIRTFTNSIRQAHASVDELRQENRKLVLAMLNKSSEGRLKSSQHHIAHEEGDIQTNVSSRDPVDPRASSQRNLLRFSEHGTGEELTDSEHDAYENKSREPRRQCFALQGGLRDSCEYLSLEGKLKESNTRCETLEGELEELHTQYKALGDRFKELHEQRDALQNKLETSQAQLFLRQEEIAGQAQAINTLNEYIQEQQVTILKLQRLGPRSPESGAEKELDNPEALVHKLITISNYSRRLGLLNSTDVIDIILHHIKGPLESVLGTISQAPDFPGCADIQFQLERAIQTLFAIICRLETALKYVANNTEYRSKEARKIIEAYASIHEGQLLSISQHLLVSPCSANAIEKPIFREPLEEHADISDPISRSGLVPTVVHRGVSGRHWYRNMVALMQRTLDNVDLICNT